ncbi:MAG: PadR family transcriptional regulator [Pseudomonadota bacterium]
MNVRTLCLAILNCGDSTGYEIRKMVSDGHFSHFVDASFGSIYPALKSMEDDGLVTCREEAQAGKPNRKIYSINDEGRKAFLEALTQPAPKDNFKSGFLLLAMCAELIEPHVMKQAIDRQIEFLHAEMASIDADVKQVDMEGAEWVGGYGRACIGMGLQYIEQNRAELERIAGSRLTKGAATAQTLEAAE